MLFAPDCVEYLADIIGYRRRSSRCQAQKSPAGSPPPSVQTASYPIVDSRPHYVRFACPDGDSTFSLHQDEVNGGGTTVYFECDDLDAVFEKLRAAGIAFSRPPQDQRWLWREAELFDPAGNRLLLYHAGENRLDPPWKVKPTR